MAALEDLAACNAVNGVSLQLGCPWLMMASQELDLELSVGPLG